MKTNLAMTNILGDIEKLLSLRKIGLEPELTSILSDGIVELDDCIFLRALLPYDFDINLAIRTAFDRTDLECEINHIHIGDYLIQSKKSVNYLLEQGVSYAFGLQDLMSGTYNVKIILAYTLEPNIDCNIRFHKKRVGEEWLADNLEEFDEALLVLD
jgi:hypothetical protein